MLRRFEYCLLNVGNNFLNNLSTEREHDTKQAHKFPNNNNHSKKVLSRNILTGVLIIVFRGVPQIAVTFEVDANGILHVTAEDKAVKNKQSIVITNDKGRPSQEEIEKMVKEAEEFAEEDRKVKERIDAKNKLETYIYSMKSTINDKDKLGDKIDSDDKESIDEALKDALEWLDDNQSAEKDDFEEKMKEVEAVCNPVIKQAYEKSGGGSMDSEDEESNDEL